MNISPPRIIALLICGAIMVGLMAAGVAWLRKSSSQEIGVVDTASGGPRKNVSPVDPAPPPEVQVDLPEGMPAGDAIRLETTIRDDRNTPVKGGILRFIWYSPDSPDDVKSRDIVISHHGLFFLTFSVPRDGRVEVRVLDGKGAASKPFRVSDHSVPNHGRGAIKMSHHFDVAPR